MCCYLLTSSIFLKERSAYGTSYFVKVSLIHNIWCEDRVITNFCLQAPWEHVKIDWKCVNRACEFGWKSVTAFLILCMYAVNVGWRDVFGCWSMLVSGGMEYLVRFSFQIKTEILACACFTSGMYMFLFCHGQNLRVEEG